MTGRIRDGYDYLPTGASGATLISLLEAAGYFFFAPAGNDPGTFFHLAPGRFNFGQALQLAVSVGGGGVFTVRPIGDPTASGVLGQAVKVGAGHVATGQFFALWDAVNNVAQVSVSLCPNGVLKAYRGLPGGTPLATSRAGSYQQEKWFALGIGGTIDNTNGALEVRVNTVPVFSIPTIDTQSSSVAGFDAFAVGAVAGGGLCDVTWDDLYLNDSAGVVNNGFLGNVRLKTQLTAGPGDLTQFAISGPAATNWQAVRNAALTDAGGYVFSPTVGQEDLYALQPILGSQVVHDVQIRTAAWQDDATQRVLHNVLKMGGVSVEGADHYLNQTPTFYTDIFETNPSTGLGMTGTEVNAGQIGPKVAA